MIDLALSKRVYLRSFSNIGEFQSSDLSWIQRQSDIEHDLVSVILKLINWTMNAIT